MGEALDAYLKARSELSKLAQAAAQEAGVGLCSSCGLPMITGMNTLTSWSGPRCADCANKR